MAKGNGVRRPHVGSNGGMLWMTRSYNVVERDPECDVFHTLYRKQRIKESDLAVLAGLQASTVKNMFGGKTRQPRHSTFAKLAGAMGKKYGLTDMKDVDYEKEIPKARAEFRAYREYMRKKREREERRTGK